MEVLSTGLSENSVDCVVTSPPYYWLRDYGHSEQLGLEDSVGQYVQNISGVMKEIYRVLKPTGLLFLNLGDTYYSGKGASKGVDKKSRKRRFGLRAVDKSGGLGIGLKPKTLIGIPWRVANAMIEDGWTLRSTIIWYRKHALPESVKDRPKRSYEFVFMFAKSRKYYYNSEYFKDIEQDDLWTITARPKTNALDTAPYPDELVERCLSIGCPQGGVVLDPFAGSGTTLRVALNKGMDTIGIDLNEDFYNFVKNDLKTL